MFLSDTSRRYYMGGFRYLSIMIDRMFSMIYILRGAFSVARFDISGNAKAFRAWNEQTGWLHVFLSVCELTWNNYYLPKELGEP